MTPERRAEILASNEAERTDQGLPLYVEDPATLERCARIVVPRKVAA